jgi:hypothetical protein
MPVAIVTGGASGLGLVDAVDARSAMLARAAEAARTTEGDHRCS